MPTFKNGGERPVIYRGIVQRPNSEAQELLIIIDGGKEKQLDYWLPYEELGLELVDKDYPPVPSTVLLSGTFKFNKGTERKYTIGHCDKYILDVIMQSGSIKLYLGSSAIGAEVSANADVPYRYHAVLDWEYAPNIRVVGAEKGTVAVIHAEMYRSGSGDVYE